MRRLLLLLAAVVLVACSPDSRKDATAVEPGGGDAVSSSSSGVHPRWVLVDSEGEAVEAIVEKIQRKGWMLREEPPANVSYEDRRLGRCVKLRAYGQEPFTEPVPYDAKTGEISPCLESGSGTFLYDSADCTGQKHLAGGSGSVVKLEGELYYPRGERRDPNELYKERPGGDCVEFEANISGWAFPAKSLPEWIPSPLPDAPYSVEPRY